MKDRIHFQLTTAGGMVCDAMASYVNAPVENGDIGILADHAPMIASLREGVIKYVTDGRENFAAVSGGILSVAGNELIILAHSAELAENIDLARAQAAEARARERIASHSAEWDMKRAETSLHRALARQKAYKLMNK